VKLLGIQLPTLRELKEDFRAMRRGEVRVAPYGTRGRIYKKRKEEPTTTVVSPAVYAATARAAGDTHAVLIRADGTRIELGKIIVVDGVRRFENHPGLPPLTPTTNNVNLRRV
jgi:hypothetical protein